MCEGVRTVCSPTKATLLICFWRLASQLALSACEREKTWKDLSAWLIWNALCMSEARERGREGDREGDT